VRTAGVRRRTRICGSLAALSLLTGCTVVSLEEDRAARERRGGAFDASRYVESRWERQILPQLATMAVPFAALEPAMAADLDAAGARFGRRAAEGSPWTFVTSGQGTVRAIDRASAEGSVELSVATPAGTRRVIVQTGPVVVDTSIRDALPFLSFNDFADQLAFAEVGRSLTEEALAGSGAAARSLEVGDRVAFLGAFNRADAGEPVRLTAVRLAPPGQGADL
jgi:predicted lipoprotein